MSFGAIFYRACYFVDTVFLRSICGAQILRFRTRSSMVFYRGGSTHRPLNPQSSAVCAERACAPTALSRIADV
eukprot:6025527-Pleurochrysis_carterae.AAC.1